MKTKTFFYNMKEDNEIEFSIPENLIEKLYEFSGDTDKYKGVILAVCSENGDPIVYHRFDCGLTELGLKKAVQEFCSDTTNNQNYDL